MEAMATKARHGASEVLVVFGERRLRPIQEKVRSTTQRRGWTLKPFTSSLRRTISIRRAGIARRLP